MDEEKQNNWREKKTNTKMNSTLLNVAGMFVALPQKSEGKIKQIKTQKNKNIQKNNNESLSMNTKHSLHHLRNG